MNSKGFTLVELLIAVAVAAILAVVAVPSYGQYISKSRIKTAQGDLEMLASHFEKRYQRVMSYPTAALSDTAALEQALPGFRPASETSIFTFSSDDAGNLSYTVKATGLSGGLDGCEISLKHNGDKAITDCGDYSRNGEWL